jgi:hypothetical protein
MNIQISKIVHFHSSDDRFCGANYPRRFTLDLNEVTCEQCKKRWKKERDRQWDAVAPKLRSEPRSNHE